MQTSLSNNRYPLTELEHYIANYFDAEKQELTDIASYFKPQQVRKGDYLLKTGRVCNQLSFISEGLVRIYVQTNDKEVTQWISNKGYFLTDLASFIFQTPARWNMQALSDCELYTIDRNDYVNLGNIVNNWHKIEKAFLAKCFVMLEDRVFSHLAMSAEERYQRFLSFQPELFNKVPLQYLASMLGMTPETLSRLRKKAIG